MHTHLRLTPHLGIVQRTLNVLLKVLIFAWQSIIIPKIHFYQSFINGQRQAETISNCLCCISCSLKREWMIFVIGTGKSTTFSASFCACICPFSVSGTSARPQTNPCAFKLFLRVSLHKACDSLLRWQSSLNHTLLFLRLQGLDSLKRNNLSRYFIQEGLIMFH